MSSIFINAPSDTTVITKEIVNEHATEGYEHMRKVTIPKHIRRIDNYAFYNCTSLQNVIFEQKSVCTEIGRWAFSRCYSLERINLPNTIVTIDRYAFQDCSSLKRINLPNTIVTIGPAAFQYCTSLEEINLPQTLTQISKTAFTVCSSLKQIVLPNSITRIGNKAFAGCSSLVYVYLPQSLQHIDEDAFFICYSLSVIAAPQHTNMHPDALGSWFENGHIIDQASEQNEMEHNALLQQRFNNHPLHQICYNPSITIDSLTKAIKQINDGSNGDYKHVDAFEMNALHVLCSNPNVSDEMISTLVATFPSLRSMQSIDGLTPVIIYIKNKYGNEAKIIIENNKPRLALDDFFRHKILREDEIVYMLASDDAMQDELSKLEEKDEKTGLYPFMKIASNNSYSLESLYWLLQGERTRISYETMISLIEPFAQRISKKRKLS